MPPPSFVLNPDAWTLFIDCKEPTAEKMAKSYISNYKIAAKVSTLAVADYWFVHSDKVWVGIERKTISDLMSSITQDGRYEDQTSRILKSEIPFMFFLIVGDLNSLGPRERKIIDSALLHLQMQAPLKVSVVADKDAAQEWIVKTHSYLCADPCPERITAPSIESIQLHCKKKKLETAQDVYIAQLMCVHGVSEKKAQAIAQVHPTLIDLVETYKKCNSPSSRTLLLKDIPCGKQKIGPTLSTRVYTCIMNETPSEPESKRKKRKTNSSNSKEEESIDYVNVKL